MNAGTIARVDDGCTAAAADPADRCGFDLWHGAGRAWVETVWSGSMRTLVLERGASHAAVAFLERRLGPGLRLGSATPYARIAGDAELFWGSLAEVRLALARRGIARLELSLSGEHLSRSRACAGFVATAPPATREVVTLAALGTPERYLAALAPNLRWALRKAQREGARVAPATAEQIGHAQALYAETMSGKGAPVNYGAERFGMLLADGAGPALGEVLLGRIGDEPAGMAAVIHSAHCHHLVQVAVPRRHQNSRLADLLVYEAVARALRVGARWFDFMATGSDDQGLAQFKAKWLGATEPLEHVAIDALPLRASAIDLGRRLRAWRSRHAR